MYTFVSDFHSYEFFCFNIHSLVLYQFIEISLAQVHLHKTEVNIYNILLFLITNKMEDYVLDKKDIDILRVFIRDSRSSYRQIGLSIGLSTNAAKTRVKKLISSGVIRQFFTTIDVAAFGYSKICYLFIRDLKNTEETLSRIRLLDSCF